MTLRSTEGAKNCTRCGELLPLDEFYFVSRKLGTRRGHCKACMSEVKAEQKDPNWQPNCHRCGATRPRSGPGRRLCQACFDAIYEGEARGNGAHRLRLNPCSTCGQKRLRADHYPGTTMCPVCRSVNQGRRKRLRTHFNMTPRDYVNLLEAQSHTCPICRRPFSKQLPPHVDHQHASPSIIRGLLCGPCNSLLGFAKDNVDRLRAAAAFLEAPPAQVLMPGREATPEGNRDSWESYRPLTRGKRGNAKHFQERAARFDVEFEEAA